MVAIKRLGQLLLVHFEDLVRGNLRWVYPKFLCVKGGEPAAENAAIWRGIPSKQVIIKTHGFHLVTKENETCKNNTNHISSSHMKQRAYLSGVKFRFLNASYYPGYE